MNKYQFATACSVLTFGLILATATATARTRETETRLRAVLQNFKTITPEILQDPANSDVLAVLRSMAKDRARTAARVLLIRLGDDDVIQSCIEQLNSGDRHSASNQLVLAANPKIIPFLEHHLFRDESADPIRVGDDVWKRPISMTAALTIKKIIVKHPAFTSDVKEWARPLPEFSPGLRVGIRAWWEKNKAAMLREDYAAVVVP